VPRKKANELAASGERWDAQQGLLRGSSTAWVPDDELAARGGVGGQARGKSPVIMRLGKEAMPPPDGHGVRRRARLPARSIDARASTQDIVEGVTASSRSASRSGAGAMAAPKATQAPQRQGAAGRALLRGSNAAGAQAQASSLLRPAGRDLELAEKKSCLGGASRRSQNSTARKLTAREASRC